MCFQLFYFIVRKCNRKFLFYANYLVAMFALCVRETLTDEMKAIGLKKTNLNRKKRKNCVVASERDPSWFEMMILSGFTILHMSCRLAVSFHTIAGFDVLHSTFHVRTVHTVYSGLLRYSSIFALRFT